MFDLSLRVLKERVFIPAAKLVVGTGVSPTHVTVLGWIWGLLACLLVAFAPPRISFFFPVVSFSSLWAAMVCWWLGRLCDGLDGTLARLTQTQTLLGGYVDILCDFSIYALLPLAVVMRAVPSMSRPEAELAYIVLALLEGAYFVNAAGLFMLSGILETRRHQHQHSTAIAHQRELTSVTMPRGLVEGFETMIFYQLFLFFPEHCIVLMSTFAAAVVLTILHRLHWAYHILK